VADAALLPRLRARLSPDALLAAGSIGLAVVTLLLAYEHVTAVAAVALAFGGSCWVLVLSVLNSMYQLSLPGWIKARSMSFYLMVFQGGGAVGSAIMGLIAERAGLSVALAIAAAGAPARSPGGPGTTRATPIGCLRSSLSLPGTTTSASTSA
jgi:predicted MFS family arabinose efflux permease